MVGLRDNLRPGMDSRRNKPVSYPKLLERRLVLVTGSLVVPTDATFCIGRAIGSGGYVASTVTTGAGGGGAWAKASFPVTPLEILDARIDAFQSQISRGGKLLLYAGAGNAALTEGGTGSGGTLLIQGKDFFRTGTKAPNSNTGGDCLGDIGDPDSINMFGKGASSTTDAAGFGGGAAKLNGVYKRETPGMMIFEFYSENPRIVF